MPYQKGHPYHPPKDPTTLPGRGRQRSARVLSLASAVHDLVPSDVLAAYFYRKAQGLINVRLAEDENGAFVTWDEQGIPPTSAEIESAVRWLADRGHGLPAQAIHVQAALRADAAVSGPQLGGLALDTAMAILALVRGEPAALPPGPASAGDDAIDAELLPASADQGADSTDHGGASEQ
jgi:hypothetical protein